MKRVTMQDIADEIGVSIGTVDRAIHNRPGISPATREKILKCIEEKGYRSSFFGGSTITSRTSIYKIGVIIQNIPSFFWGAVKKGIMVAARDFSHYGIEIVLKELDVRVMRESSKLVEKMDELVKENVNAIIVVPSNNEAVKNKINELVDKGIVIVTLNDDVNGTKRLFYVGPHIGQDGRLAGELMGLYLKGKGNVLIINNDIESWEYSERIRGFSDILKEKYPEVTILAQYTYNYRNLVSGNDVFLLKILEEAENINGIYDLNSITFHQVGHLIKKNEKLKNTVLIGHEIWGEVRELMKEGYIKACISQDPFSQGYFAVRQLCRYVFEGKTPEYERMYTKLEIIMKENLEGEDSIAKLSLDY
ncbi:MAG TPA: substrate-binding domain-containing protein [Clostridiaceae bacterium]|nr:substrate-binding domain-containing protein [Clostridiaceae bacterium]